MIQLRNCCWCKPKVHVTFLRFVLYQCFSIDIIQTSGPSHELYSATFSITLACLSFPVNFFWHLPGVFSTSILYSSFRMHRIPATSSRHVSMQYFLTLRSYRPFMLLYSTGFGPLVFICRQPISRRSLNVVTRRSLGYSYGFSTNRFTPTNGIESIASLFDKQVHWEPGRQTEDKRKHTNKRLL